MQSVFALDFVDTEMVLHNPSVKNQRFLTAPFTQGSLYRTSIQSDKSQFRHNEKQGVEPATPCYASVFRIILLDAADEIATHGGHHLQAVCPQRLGQFLEEIVGFVSKIAPVTNFSKGTGNFMPIELAFIRKPMIIIFLIIVVDVQRFQ